MEETAETKEQRRREQKRDWYERNKELTKQRALNRYYANHEENKTAAREKARAMKAELLELRARLEQIPGNQ